MSIARRYYKVTCAREFRAAGAGLGYEEMFGDGPRFFWDEADAKKRATLLNASTQGDACFGEYFVEERNTYADGSWDDEGDDYARRQLGL